MSLNVEVLFVVLNIIFQIISSKNLLSLLSCHILIIVVMFGPTARLTLTLSSKLQILLNNLARIILSADIRTNIDSMMSSLKWLKLDDRWNNHILVMLYKCLTGRAPNYLCSKFSFTNSTHDHDTRGTSSNSFVVPQFKNNWRGIFFFFGPELQICGIVLLMLILILIIFP